LIPSRSIPDTVDPCLFLNAGANGKRIGSRTGDCASPATPFALSGQCAKLASDEPWWAPPCLDVPGGRTCFSGAVGTGLTRWKHARGLAVTRRPVARTGTARGGIRRVSHAGTARLAQGRAGYETSEKQCRCARRLEKNCPKCWQPSPSRKLEKGLPRLASQKETVRNITGWPWIISLNLNTTYTHSRKESFICDVDFAGHHGSSLLGVSMDQFASFGYHGSSTGGPL
jgi:hypothetical protein